jgi:hypothetical protein
MLTQIRSDLAAGETNTLTVTDIAIWETPESTTYVDGTLRRMFWCLYI